jgi:hypothetical protein
VAKHLSRLQKLKRVKDTYKRFLRGQKAQLAPGDSIEQVHKVELQEGMRNESPGETGGSVEILRLQWQ